MWTDTTTIKRNGFIISYWYEGIEAYHIEKDGKCIYHGWNLDDVIRITGVNPYELKEEEK